ncbi:hypothetical protein F2P56_015913 [Juglans regia]|uniref:Uncharacterized protein n=1 Tax=Juglans regia TaxID=51240 RepID=A0A834CW05_JUGRE|nr:hypothetical protein F2P56_015913 [Juglans regia]
MLPLNFGDMGIFLYFCGVGGEPNACCRGGKVSRYPELREVEVYLHIELVILQPTPSLIWREEDSVTSIHQFGEQMAQTGRGGGSRGEGDSSSNDSTQPPSIVFKIEFLQPMPDAPTNRELNDSTRGDSDAVQVPLNGPTKKRGRGPAKCTEFEKFRKHGKIPLKINGGETAPCCENATMFTTRVTWILKHHADMSYARWTDVPKAEKDELIERVRDDFELDWELKNHQLTVWKQLRKRFNAFHHELHMKYLKYGSHEEALANGTSLVEPHIWVKLCGRWGSDAFKKMSEQNKENRKRLKINHTAGRKSFVRILEEKRSRNENLVNFYKDVRWSKKKDQFVTSTTEDLYRQPIHVGVYKQK